MLKEMAKSKLRRIPGRNQTFARTDIAVGDSATCYGQISRESTQNEEARTSSRKLMRPARRPNFEATASKLRVIAFVSRRRLSRSRPWGSRMRENCCLTGKTGKTAPEPCKPTLEVPAGAPADEPMPDGQDLWRRMSVHSEVTCMIEDMPRHALPPSLAQAPVAPTPDEPDMSPQFYDDMWYEEIHELRKQRGYAKRDAKSHLKTRPLDMDRIDRGRVT